jgi:hypothetical protein
MIKSSIVTLEDFSGGLNTKAGNMQLQINESPNCLNCHSNLFKSLQWRQGSRYLNPTPLTDLNGNGMVLYPFWSSGTLKERLVSFWANKMYCMDDLNASFYNVPFATAQGNDEFDATIYSTATQNYLIIGNYLLTALQVYNGSTVSNLDQSVLTGSRNVISWKRHLWCAYNLEAGSTYPYRLRRTDIGTYGTAAADWTGGVAGYDDIVTNDGDYCTGFAILRGFLYLFKRYSIFRISYLGGSPLVEIRQISSIGTEAPKSITNITLLNGDEILTFLGTDNRIYIFNGYNAPQPISELISENNGYSAYSLPKVNKALHRKAVGLDYAKRHWYLLFLTFGDSALENNGGYIIDYYTTPFSIFPFDGWQASGACIVKDSLGSQNGYIQGYDGRARQIDYGDTDCGTAIDSYYETSKMKLDKLPALKKVQQAQIYIKRTGDYNIKFGYRTDFNVGYIEKDISLGPSGFILGTSLLGTGVLGGFDSKVDVMDIPRLLNFLQFRIHDMSTNPRINLYTIDLMATTEGIGKTS